MISLKSGRAPAQCQTDELKTHPRTLVQSKSILHYPSIMPVTTNYGYPTNILYRYIADQGNLVILTLLHDSTCFTFAVLCFIRGHLCVCTS